MSRTMNEAKVSIDFASSIAAYAMRHHLDLTAEAADSLAQTLAAVVRIGEDNQVSFIIGNDKMGDLDTALDLYSAGTPRKTASVVEIDPAGMNPTEYAIARNRAARETKSAAAVSAIVSDGNPWAKETWSRTHQALVTNANPTLATQLKASAGIQP